MEFIINPQNLNIWGIFALSPPIFHFLLFFLISRFICQYCGMTVNASLWVKTLMHCSSHRGWVIPLSSPTLPFPLFSCPPLSSIHLSPTHPLFSGGNRLCGCVERVTPPQAPLTLIKPTALVCVRKKDLCKDQACWYHALTNKEIIIKSTISLECNQPSKGHHCCIFWCCMRILIEQVSFLQRP